MLTKKNHNFSVEFSKKHLMIYVNFPTTLHGKKSIIKPRIKIFLEYSSCFEYILDWNKYKGKICILGMNLFYFKNLYLIEE